MTSKDDGSIQERQVTVRVLTIGTKQVTQTMYKQLPEEQVINDETGALDGEVWGWVNLHDKDCPEDYHLHAIWESDGQLKRACTSISCNTQYYRYLRADLMRLTRIYICLVALSGGTFTNWHRGSDLPLTIKGLKLAVSVPENVSYIWSAPSEIQYRQQGIAESKDPGWYQNDIDAITERVESIKRGGIEECLRGYHWDDYKYQAEQYTSHKEVYAAMESMADVINLREQRWIKSYLAVRQSGQLFIAVSGVWK